MKLFFLLAIFVSTPVMACGLTAADISESLALTYDQFDQTMGQGARKYADQNCFIDAAVITEAYLLRHDTDPSVDDGDKKILNFHAGQYYAMADASTYDAAIDRINLAHIDQEPPDFPITWNVYVDATIAFLKGDLATLKQRRLDMNAKQTDMQKINEAVVDGLIKCFGHPYLEAYSSSACRQ